MGVRKLRKCPQMPSPIESKVRTWLMRPLTLATETVLQYDVKLIQLILGKYNETGRNSFYQKR